MKRLYTFTELPAELQPAAIAKVRAVAEARTRYNGEVWVESAADLARLATFTVTRKAGLITGIWDVTFAKAPTVRKGTEWKSAA